MTLELWQAMAEDVDAGGAFTITAGCALQNLQGEVRQQCELTRLPQYTEHFALIYPDRGGKNDGGNMN